MKVLHAAAEIFPLVKTGGLADVMGALPQALHAAGADARVVLPGLPDIVSGVANQRLICELGALFGAAKVSLRLGQLPGSGLPAYVIDAPYLYRRSGNPYLGPNGQDWGDNVQRFGLLGWVAAHIASGELDPAWHPDVLHAHDWHAAMACAYVATHPGASAATVFTVHNLAYQGVFDDGDFHLLGLPTRLLTPSALEYHGQFSFMKAGLICSTRVTTVSPTYAREMATGEYGCGLDGVVRDRGTDVSGILNGVDGAVWSPQTDPAIPAKYSAQDLRGKAVCKAAYQKAMGLTIAAKPPLFGIVSRLTSQKGLDLVLACLPELLAGGGQLAVQGSGDAALEAAFADAALAHPGRVAVHIGYNEALAHQMVAAADVMLVPSRFEPCGLTQLYALRYGTVPLVRRVGGLADTVVNATTGTLNNQTATGFMFDAASAPALSGAVAQAVKAFAQPTVWQRIVQQGMAQDFSWAHAAQQYLALYREAMVAGPRGY